MSTKHEILNRELHKAAGPLNVQELIEYMRNRRDYAKEHYAADCAALSHAELVEIVVALEHKNPPRSDTPRFVDGSPR